MEDKQTDQTAVWHKTARVLCSNNSGVEVRLDGRIKPTLSYPGRNITTSGRS